MFIKSTLCTYSSEANEGSEQRRGMNAIAVAVEREGSLAHTVLSHARKVSVRLIFMAAFERSKFRQALFEGVTTDVIAKSNMPVFMAH